jgi:arylsulfatase A
MQNQMIATLSAIICTAVFSLIGQNTSLAAEPAVRPNIVIIMADDMGYAGLSCYGNPYFKTPHLDKLAAEGLKFTDFHSSGTVCSPTRAGLLTGRYQQRSGIDGVVNADPKHPYHQRGLAASEITFADMLSVKGYATGIMGKWHVGYKKQFNPTLNGFDQFVGFISGNIDYISHYDRVGTFDWWHNRTLNHEPGYSTHLINQHALKFIETNRDRPFCLYVSHEAIHNPNQGPDDPAIRGPNKQPKKKISPVNDAVREMTLAMDDGVGQIVAKLRELKLDKKTLVFFFSDNGGTSENRSVGNKLRGKKGMVWEGGHRVPAIAWWPGRVPAGASTDQLAMTIDVMPTLQQLAGASVPADHKLDGMNLSPTLFEKKTLAPRKRFWGHVAGSGAKSYAMRDGSWKLVSLPKSKPQLFDLGRDLKESNNLAAEQPERTKSMLAALNAWREDVEKPRSQQPSSNQ